MQRENNSGDSLLSSRLQKKQTGPDRRDAAPDMSALRRKQSEASASVPAYEAEETAPAAEKKRFKQEKIKTDTLKSRPLDRLSAKKADKPTRKAVPSHSREALDDMPDPDAFEEELERETLDKARRRERVKRAKGHAVRLVTIIMILLCGYMAFLIYGVTQTDYIYDENGNVVAEILSIEDKKSLSEYEVLSQYYLRARILYEEALTLDYRLAGEPESSLSIAMEYSGMLDKVAKLSVDIDAADFSTAYTGIQGQLLNWVKTDIAVYLQNISAAITNNDSDKAEKAIISRDVMYNDFSTLTSNMATLCWSTKGAKNGDIFAWSPESFVDSIEEG